MLNGAGSVFLARTNVPGDTVIYGNLSHTCTLHGCDSMAMPRSPENQVLRYPFSS